MSSGFSENKDLCTRKFSRAKKSGAPNEGFLLDAALKTLFRLSRVLLDL